MDAILKKKRKMFEKPNNVFKVNNKKNTEKELLLLELM